MRKSKIFDQLIEALRRSLMRLPEHRRGANIRYTIADAGLSAFGVFFTQSRSFLAYQRLMETAKGKSNVHSLFGVERIPSDAHIRNLLDPQEPSGLFEVFEAALGLLEEHGLWDRFRSYDGQILVSCDGTQTIASQTIHCAACSQRDLGNGETLYAHYAILPVVVKAGEPRVVVLPPEYLVRQEGQGKQDSERAAIKRWLKTRAPRLPQGTYTLLGDDLYACQPICEAILAAGWGFILVCKPESHVALYEQVDFLAKNGLVEETERRRWNGRFHAIHRYRWVNGVPLRRGKEALQVNWCELTITREEDGKRLYHNTFITHHTITEGNVAAIVRDGRARWKSENETNNVLKTKGYHLEHNFGHGQMYLANFLLTLNLLAFLFHTSLDLADERYHALRHKIGTRQDFFHDLRALLRYLFFEDWHHLMHFMLVSLELVPDI